MNLADLFISRAYAEEAKDPYISFGLEPRFHKIGQNGWIALGVVVLFAVVMLIVILTNKKKKWTVRMLTNGAIAISLSFVLSFIRLARMGNGGSVTLASMLPMMLFSAVFGVGPGVAAGLIYGVLQYLQGGDFLSVWQVIFDYLIAFAALGLAGLYRYTKQGWQVWLTIGLSAVLLVLMIIGYPSIWGLYAVLLAALAVLAFFVARDPERFSLLPAMGIAVLGRAASAVIAGLMWVAAYPVEGQAPFVYSVIYNGAYLVPELVICMAVAGLTGNRLLRMMEQQAKK